MSSSGPWLLLAAAPAAFKRILLLSSGDPCYLPEAPVVRQRSLPLFDGFCRLPAEPAVFQPTFHLLADLRFSALPATIQRPRPPSSGTCHLSTTPATFQRFLPSSSDPYHILEDPVVFRRALISSRGSCFPMAISATFQRTLPSFIYPSTFLQPCDSQRSLPPSSGLPSSGSCHLPSDPVIFQRSLSSSSGS
jgi:hypothetical protein